MVKKSTKTVNIKDEIEKEKLVAPTAFEFPPLPNEFDISEVPSGPILPPDENEPEVPPEEDETEVPPEEEISKPKPIIRTFNLTGDCVKVAVDNFPDANTLASCRLARRLELLASYTGKQK